MGVLTVSSIYQNQKRAAVSISLQWEGFILSSPSLPTLLEMSFSILCCLGNFQWSLNTLIPKISLVNSPYCVLHNSYGVCLGNLDLDQLLILKLITILVTCQLDIVRINSVLVTHGSWRSNG